MMVGWIFSFSRDQVDDRLKTRVSWPFPLLITGGIDPGIWRLISGIGAYDLTTVEIDVTPWLRDGESHSLGLKVVAYNISVDGHIGPVGENW